MQLIHDTISVDELKKMSEKMFNRIVKAVVDIEKEIFDSMINMRPSSGNRSRSVEDPATQKKIIDLVNKLVKR